MVEDNIFTRKLGPLETWQWMGVGTGVLGVAWLYEKKKSASSANVSGTASTAAAEEQLLASEEAAAASVAGATTPNYSYSNSGNGMRNRGSYSYTPPAASVGGSTPTIVTTGGGSTATIIVPNVVGQSAGIAHNTIVAAGLVPYDPNANVSGEPGKLVTSTSPTAGTSAASGSKVTLTTGGAATGGTTTSGSTKTPATPTGVAATGVTASSISIKWNKSTGATSYNIRTTYQSQLVKSQTTTSTSATISGLGADHTYGIHVAAVNSAGTSSEGDVNVKTSKS